MANSRQRLGNDVAVRRHLVSGREVVVLHQLEIGRSAVIGAREWDLLQGADGSRDALGMVAAALQRGRHVRADQAQEFMDMLAAAGMLQAGPELPPEAVSAPLRPDRPLRVLPDFALQCSGAGTCCRLYPTTLFSAVEAARARGLLPEVLNAGDDETRGFTPRRGARLLPWQARAVSMVDGHCSYLDEARRCRLHARGGAEGKPAGCQLFPLTFADDGESLRVSVAPECSCVFDSLASEQPSPDSTHQDVAGPRRLLDAAMQRSADLPLAAWIEPARAEVAISAGHSWPYARYAELRDELLARVDGERDVAALLWQLGATLAAAPEDVPAAFDALTGTRTLRLGPGLWAASMRGRLAAQREQDDGWRGPKDLVRHALSWLAAAAAEEQPLATSHDAADERFYLRATAFGDLWLRADEPPLAGALMQRATRIWLARAGRMLPPAGLVDDPAWRQPLALVEALARGYGLQLGPVAPPLASA